jgi:hypothetical protein
MPEVPHRLFANVYIKKNLIAQSYPNSDPNPLEFLSDHCVVSLGKR